MSIFKDSRILSIPIVTIVFIVFETLSMVGDVESLPKEIIIGVGLVMAYGIIRRGVSIDKNMLAFLLYIPIEIIVVQPDARFRSMERFVLFLMIMTSVSPLLQSKYARSFRSNALYLYIFIVAIASIASFFAYFIGYNLMIVYGSNEYMGIAGHFGGLFRHSMNLGSMSAVSTIYLTYKGLQTHKNRYFALAILCVGSVLFSASRGAFIGLLLSIIFLFKKFSKDNKQFLNIVFALVVMLAITVPIWRGAMSGLEAKQENNITAGSIVTSRAGKWECRIDEFTSNPFWGVGFASIDPFGQDEWDKETGMIEPGTSWLSIFSMLGLFGFIIFMFVYVRSFNALKSTNEDRSSVLFALLMFFSIHMIVEGYIFATSSPSCVMFWLIFACCYDLRFSSEKSVWGQS